MRDLRYILALVNFSFDNGVESGQMRHDDFEH
jgi:hypothetical protein